MAHQGLSGSVILSGAFAAKDLVFHLQHPEAFCHLNAMVFSVPLCLSGELAFARC
jgi:hypothetical protein